jgi:Domain of unknown function (DUF4328)
MQGYESARGRAQLVDVLLAAQIALYALRFVGGIYVAVAPDGDLGRMLARGERLSVPFLLVLFVVTAFAFIAWLHRAARNLPSLHVAVERLWGAFWLKHVVASFFVPLFNLLTIPYVVRQVWLESDPTLPRRRWLVAVWWVSLLEAALIPPVLGAAFMLTSAVCLLGIVRDTQRRQDEQILDEELRRAAPLPTADALR